MQIPKCVPKRRRTGRPFEQPRLVLPYPSWRQWKVRADFERAARCLVSPPRVVRVATTLAQAQREPEPLVPTEAVTPPSAPDAPTRSLATHCDMHLPVIRLSPLLSPQRTHRVVDHNLLCLLRIAPGWIDHDTCHSPRKGGVRMGIERSIAIALMVRWAPDGFSIDLDGHGPIRRPGRFMVSLAGHERQFRHQPGTDEVVDFIIAHWDHLSLPGRYLGGWRHGGISHLDVSIIVPGLDNALTVARKNSQKAVYDLWSQTSIDVADAIRIRESPTPLAQSIQWPSDAYVWGTLGPLRDGNRSVDHHLIERCLVAC